MTGIRKLKEHKLEALLLASRAGHSRAFAEIVQRFRPSLLKRAYRILRDTHLAEDAVQETFLEAHKKLGTLKVDAAFASWTARILFKYCDRILRRRPEVAVAPERFRELEDPRKEREAPDLDSLSGLDRAIADAFFNLGKPQKEIAFELEIPLHTVKNRLKKTRILLKKLYGTSVELRAA